MDPIMIRVSENKAEVLGSDGWHETDWVPLPGGNFLSVNHDSYWAGVFQGGAVMLLMALVFLGVYAGAAG
jgi:hypothetical protein